MEFFIKAFDELTTREIYEILRARELIFTHEKGMKCLDIDRNDYNCLHCILTDGDTLIAYLRAEKCDTGAKVGRVITLTHGRGDGRLLMEKSIPAIKNYFGTDNIYVHAQHDAVGFYLKMGFIPISDEYIEAGVRHISMMLEND
jgi:ElaA protein